MSGVDTYKSRLDPAAWRVFENTLVSRRRHGQNTIYVEHFLEQLLIDADVLLRRTLETLNVNPETFRSHVERRIESRSQLSGAEIHLDRAAIEMFKEAWRRAMTKGRAKITTPDLILAMAQDTSGPLVEILTAMNVDRPDIPRVVQDVIRSEPKSETEIQPSEETAFDCRKGDTVRITAGAFSAMSAKVVEVDYERSVLRVIVNIYGRHDAIELRFADVEKISFA